MPHCPYCRRPAMTAMEKLRIGPRHTLACRSCGKKISVSRAALPAIMAPVSVSAFVAHVATAPAIGVAALTAGGVAAVWLYLRAVPLVGRDDA